MFRGDRIVEVVDQTSGECFATFEIWLLSLGPESAESKGMAAAPGRAWAAVHDGCTILMYLARIDGEAARTEELAIARWLFDAIEADGENCLKERSYCARIARGLWPSDDEFQLSLTAFVATADAVKARRLLVAAALVADADGAIVEQEARLFARLESSLAPLIAGAQVSGAVPSEG